MGIYDRDYYTQDPPRGLSPSWDGRSAISMIIITCVGVFFANMIFTPRNHEINQFLGLHADDYRQPWMLWRLLTYGFVHSPFGVGHILWNMFGLWMLGRAVEERYGTFEFWRIYLVSVVFCGAVWLLRNSMLGEPASVIGASGAVCCIEMLFVYNFPRVILMFWGIIPIPAWVLGLLIVGGNLMTQDLSSSGSVEGPRIAVDVHLAGIVFATGYFFMNWNFGRLAKPVQLWKQIQRRWFAPKLKVHEPVESSLMDEEEADRILKKIHEQGQDSLSSKEKRFMEKYSRRVRKRRDQSI